MESRRPYWVHLTESAQHPRAADVGAEETASLAAYSQVPSGVPGVLQGVPLAAVNVFMA